MNTDSIRSEITIAAPRERVWSLLTEAEHLGRWFGDAGADIDLRLGGEVILRWTEHGTTHGIVEAIEPQTRFALRWAPFKDPGGTVPVPGNSTLIEFTLASAGDGTQLTVVESGFDSLECTTDQRVGLLAGNTRGWSHELGELAGYATTVAI
jgi:uncharacterized protein YndB with AHSA1/START domain